MAPVKQREKQPRLGGITGRGFVPGDPRINRTRPGPGRPSLGYREALAALEPAALQVVAEALHAKQWSVRFAAARDVLDRLHGKPGQLQVTNGGFNSLADLIHLAESYEADDRPVLVINGDKRSYVEGLRRARQYMVKDGVTPTGATNGQPATDGKQGE